MNKVIVDQAALWVHTIFSGDRDCRELICGLPGECLGIIVGLDLVDSENQCINACKEESLCAYWTYKASTGQCSMYEECSEIDTIGCPSCTYGEKLCPIEPVCGQPGECIGEIVALELVDNENECISACKEESLCNYWVYKSFTGQCPMYEDCPEIDSDECPSCTYGKKLCPTEQVCGQPGKCIGGTVALELFDNENECINACKEESLCNYWVYKSSTGQCIMYEDCSQIDVDECSSCVYGEKLCPFGAGNNGCSCGINCSLIFYHKCLIP